ncbi:MAG: glycosyltransferase [Bacillaceae bacterium]|nr:glycosyltransferase [Bacillaceae bacterium]
MNEKVSIVIPTYNCKFVDQAIESALNQTYQNIEVIVVNDGSKKYQEKIKPYFGKIRYIYKGNGGTASALNMGIKNATGEYFCWLSSDDQYVPEKVEKQLNFMKSIAAYCSYSAYYTMNDQSQITNGPIGVHFPNKMLFYKKLRAGCPINGCTVMLNMKVLNEVGVFDETLPYTHDYDLWLRIIQKYDFTFLNDPLVKYRVHEEMGTKKFDREIRKEIQLVKNRHQKELTQLILREVNL